MTQKEIKIVVDAGEAKKELEKVTKGLEKTEKASEEVSGKLDDMTGGAITKFRQMSTALKTVAMGFRTVGTAIALSGLGLLVITLGAVITAFKSSEEAEDKFAIITAQLGQIVSKLVDTFASLGEKIIWVFENPKKAVKEFAKAIQDNITNRINGLLELFPQLGLAIEAVFSGDFSKAGKIAVNAVGKVALGVENTTDKLKGLVKGTKEYVAELERQRQAGIKIAKMRDEAEDLERALITRRATADEKISGLREKMADKEQYNLQQRISFGKQAQQIENSITQDELKASKLKSDAIILENSLTRSNTDALLAAANAEAEVTKKQTELNMANRRFLKELSTLTKEARGEEASAMKAKMDAIKAVTDAEIAEKKRLNDLKLQADADYLKRALDLQRELTQSQETPAEKEEREFKEKFKVLSDNKLSTELLEKLHKEKMKQIELDSWSVQSDISTKATDESNKKKKEEEATAKAVQTAKDNIAYDGLALITSIAEEGSVIAKAAGVADATISGIRGVQNAFTSAQDSPITKVFPAYPFVQAGIAGAFSAVQIGKIIKGAKPSGSEGGGGGGGEGRAPSFNMIAGTGTDQITSSINDQSKQPLKAFVVSGEMTSQQQLDNSIKSVGTI